MRRAAGFLLYRKFESEIQYLLLKASYGNKHWTPPKGFVYDWNMLVELFLNLIKF